MSNKHVTLNSRYKLISALQLISCLPASLYPHSSLSICLLDVYIIIRTWKRTPLTKSLFKPLPRLSPSCKMPPDNRPPLQTSFPGLRCMATKEWGKAVFLSRLWENHFSPEVATLSQGLYKILQRNINDTTTHTHKQT